MTHLLLQVTQCTTVGARASGWKRRWTPGWRARLCAAFPVGRRTTCTWRLGTATAPAPPAPCWRSARTALVSHLSVAFGIFFILSMSPGLFLRKVNIEIEQCRDQKHHVGVYRMIILLPMLFRKPCRKIFIYWLGQNYIKYTCLFFSLCCQVESDIFLSV